MTALRDTIVENKLHQTFWVLNPNSGDTGGLLLDDWKTWDEAKYALLKPALWSYQNKFVSLDHQVRLGANGISLAERYAGTNPSEPGPSSPTPSNPVPSSSSSAPTPSGTCTATFKSTGNWQGGFQAEVTVTNAGTAAGRTWTVGWTYPSGTTVASLWNGVLSTSGSAVTVRNAGHNGSLAPGAATAFGFVGSGAAATPGALTCSLS
jgi:endoglucanase